MFSLNNSDKPKRLKNELSLDQKREIILYYHEHPKLTQLNLSIFFSEKFGKRIARQTVSDILAAECKLFQNENIKGPDTKRITNARFPLIEECLTLWLSDVRAHGVNVNDDIIREKAKIFGSRLGYGLEFKYSNGWLEKFKKRHGLASFIASGESGSVDKTLINCEIVKLSNIVSKFSRADVFNFDETALFYRLQPNRTLANQAVNGIKSSKDRLSIGVCSNADGSEKCRLVVIDKFKKPRCFGNFDPNNIVNYYANQKAWMTSLIFSDWLEKFNKKMKNSNRHKLLLLDNASSHKTDKVFSNITLHFLPPNTTSVLQPLDAGIIRSLKAIYKNLLVKSLLKSIEMENKVVLPNLKEVILMINTACTKSSLSSSIAEENLILNDLVNNLDRFNLYQFKFKPKTDALTVDEFITSDDKQPTGEKLEIDDIVSIVKPVESLSENDKDTEVDTNDIEPVKITKEEVFLSLKNIKHFFTDSEFFDKNDLDQIDYITERFQDLIEIKKKQSCISDFWK
ncbi:unnamed protein product [Brachionus calyciflorus]|uniref:HTH CENPB-type domain-containing protein n=1 Tax=Brachionus calyciflorus TaxID=104777 RepID=A0A814G2V2_9BILA|nr:unnamed protein product [Brachionus calyciflorus]